MCREKFHKMLKINDLRTFSRSLLGARTGFGAAFVLLAVLGTLLCGCGEPAREYPGKSASVCAESAVFSQNMYARMFRTGTLCGVPVAEIFSVIGRDTLVRRFVLLDSAAVDSLAGAVGVRADSLDVRSGAVAGAAERSARDFGGVAGVTVRGLPGDWKAATVLRVPLSRVVTLSSAQVGFVSRLGFTDRIVAVSDAKYIVDSSLFARAGVAAGGTIGVSQDDSAGGINGEAAVGESAAVSAAASPAESAGGSNGAASTLAVAESVTTSAAFSAPLYSVGSGTALDVERLAGLSPDIVMSFATGGGQDDYERINAVGLPLMLTSEWQEESVLAKAEWIRLYGMLFGAAPLADSIFRDERTGMAVYSTDSSRGLISADPCVESVLPVVGRNGKDAYIPLKKGPRVLAGMSYGGVWYAPGGSSFTADLVRKAGGCYLWAGDSARELKLPLEAVMALADSADVWVNPGAFVSPDEILAAEPRAGRIRAFREGRVCQNDGVRGAGGGNDFYESAVTRPADLLRSLSDCIHSPKAPHSQGISPGPRHNWYRNIYTF